MGHNPGSRPYPDRGELLCPALRFTIILQHFYRAFMTRDRAPSILLSVAPEQRPFLRDTAGLPDISRVPLCGAGMHHLEHTMPINQVGEIAYQPAAPMEGIRWQADPPVCNRCWHEIPPPRILGRSPSWAIRPPQAALNSSSVPRVPRCAPVMQRRRSFGCSTTTEHDLLGCW